MKLNPHLYDDDPELRSILIALLKKRRGFCVDLFDMLHLLEFEDGRFGVYVEKKINDFEEFIFDDPKKAVDFFLETRRKLALGYDFERITPWPAILHKDESDAQLHIHVPDILSPTK